MVSVVALGSGRVICWASASSLVDKTASSAGLSMVLVHVKANHVTASVFLGRVANFIGFAFDSNYGVSFYCCSFGFLDLAVVSSRCFMDLTVV